MDPYERARITRNAERLAIVQSLHKNTPIPDIAQIFGMTEHEMRCILRAMNAIATLKRGIS